MRIDILTVVPELLQSPLNESILKRAQQKGLVEICVHNLRDYAFDKHRQVDDYPFGGEAGMVMKAEPIFLCIEELQRQRSYDEIIYTRPMAGATTSTRPTGSRRSGTSSSCAVTTRGWTTGCANI